ncbi:MAG: symmetrical bis(5'-nucleosyl)-tetraphosphatase [Rhodoferax sp.]
MALYLIGDVQGCDTALQQLLDTLDFSPSRDTIYLLGDLVNRGPDSAAVLRRLMGYGAAARCLLGNHDLHLLTVAHGVRKPHRMDTLDGILNAPDRSAMLAWLCQQHMALFESIGTHDLLMVHAGVLPQWTAWQTLELAAEVEVVLRGPDLVDFLHQMYGNEPTRWKDSLTGVDRLRVVVNALTRLRFCTPKGKMEFDTKDSSGGAPAGYLPWFEVPGRRTADVTVAFGHWSTLGWLGRSDVLSLDTGCVWGGALSALRIGSQAGTWTQELIQVACQAAQQPGKSL